MSIVQEMSEAALNEIADAYGRGLEAGKAKK